MLMLQLSRLQIRTLSSMQTMLLLIKLRAIQHSQLLAQSRQAKFLRFRLKKCQDPAILLWKHLKKWFTLCIPTSSQSLQQTQQRLRMRQRQRLKQQPQLRQQQPQAIQSRLPISIILPLHQTFHSNRKMKMTR